VCVSGGCQISCNDGFETCTNGQCGALTGGTCTVDEDCCFGHCQNTGYCCALPGSPCGVASDCNDNLCIVGQAMQCQNEQCCLPGGATCTANTDCCAPDGGTAKCSLGFCSN
jgi:hypothetical protein